MILFPREKAVLVGIELPREKLFLAELARLTETAGAAVVGQFSQKRQHPDPKYFIGSGKLEELQAAITGRSADLVIFDHELSASQQRNLEDILQLKVIDRTELILDIFARHARSREGKLQVEMAQASFRMTRLTGHGVQMSRLGGGIGTRGPGETKLEVDRRAIRSRLAFLRTELEKIRKERKNKREKRRQGEIASATIVGYTNAGKSTLFNALTRAGVLVEDKLFATLDPVIRRLYLPSGHFILLTDTVGFIQKLPHQLITAFHATLEEVSDADILLHVVDISAADFESQISSVYNVLEELNAIAKPMLTILNKTDRASAAVIAAAQKKYRPACAVSALEKQGLTEMLAKVDALLPGLPV